jgi:hypothetical protein
VGSAAEESGPAGWTVDELPSEERSGPRSLPHEAQGGPSLHSPEVAGASGLDVPAIDITQNDGRPRIVSQEAVDSGRGAGGMYMLFGYVGDDHG